MKGRLLFILCVSSLFFSLPRPAAADGIIIIDPPIVDDWPPYLVVKYHRVTVTIENQVVTTHVDQVFINPSPHRIEGTYVFPLPEEATINDFGMWVDGELLKGEILPADRARSIYEDIVRRQRDPALLEYIGRNTFRARIFPIEPHAEKRVEIEYTEILTLDNGMVHYRYPLDTERFSPQPIEDVSIHVQIHSNEAIKTVYSSSHDIAIDRQDDYNVAIGYEDIDVLPATDFHLYYTVTEQEIGLNLLSYTDGYQDGFFLLLLAPQVQVDETKVVARDVILVLDKSGSMRGEKLNQAKKALKFVLDSLNQEDRFNVIEFSTGVRQFSEGPIDASARGAAQRWVENLEAGGGTDINRAMLEALAQADGERPTIIIFLTDGLPTEGVIDAARILSNVEEAASENARIFTFGVGDDVNTLLLDRMARDHRGTSAYVRPGQQIDEKVSAFYAKVSTPLLSDISLDFGGIHTYDTYPYPFPDLFAGTQILMVGRYRQGGDTTVTLRGTVNEQEQIITFEDVRFYQEQGNDFVPRLWATRKVGYLLNQIRLHGESQELVQEIVDLAVRYGIMTPYTSFLVQEDVEVFSPEGRRETAEREYSVMATAMPAPPAGKAAVDDAEAQRVLEESNVSTGATERTVKIVGNKTFLLRGDLWVDTIFDSTKMTPAKVGFVSDEYFALLRARPEWGAFFSIGERVLVVLDTQDGKGPQAYEIVPEGEGESIALPDPKATPTVYPTRVAQAPTASPAPSATRLDRQPTLTPVPSTTKSIDNLVTAPSSKTGPAICTSATAFLLISIVAAFIFARRQ
ncbi:MAG: VWA domain-containing protein [Anaerolineae bacterium]|nr:VWA domain-containing protein [Anaerolineae bacterium]